MPGTYAGTHANDSSTYPNESDGIELKNMQIQLEALQAALAQRDSQIEALKADHENKEKIHCNGDSDIAESAKLKEAFESLQNEQEDLLMMLSDQDMKLRKYRKILKNLGQIVSEDEEEEDLETADLSDD